VVAIVGPILGAAILPAVESGAVEYNSGGSSARLPTRSTNGRVLDLAGAQQKWKLDRIPVGESSAMVFAHGTGDGDLAEPLTLPKLFESIASVVTPSTKSVCLGICGLGEEGPISIPQEVADRFGVMVFYAPPKTKVLRIFTFGLGAGKREGIDTFIDKQHTQGTGMGMAITYPHRLVHIIGTVR
jgi:hypothetical protein